MSVRAEWPVCLSWEDLVLRPMRRRDRDEWNSVRARNQAWLEPWEATRPEPSEGQLPFGRFVREQNHRARQGHALPWLITERDPRSARHGLVGQLTVDSIIYGAFRSATLGYWVDGGQAGRGIAPMAVAMATDYCFQYLRLHRMQINIRPENTPSLRVVEKLGFREEGYYRDYLHIGGRWTDHRSFALTAPEVPQGLVRQFSGTQEGLRRHAGWAV